MSASRTLCPDCGFEVTDDSSCPLCGHELHD
jgi:rubrerythrin